MTPILVVERDGGLLEVPADGRVDAYEKLRLVEGVVPALLTLRDAGYALVMACDPGGPGAPSAIRERSDGPHRLMLQIFESQGIRFRDALDGEPDDGPAPLEARLARLAAALRNRDLDWSRSAVVGGEAAAELARALGVRCFRLRVAPCSEGRAWAEVAHELALAPRTATVVRTTRETAIRVAVDLDRAAEPDVRTGIGFFDHMLEQLGTHGGFALEVRAEGDLRVDEHHTVEDTALALGQALSQALGARRGVARYGFTLPMDEALASAALDLSGRPRLEFAGAFRRERVGDLPTELVPHFFWSLCEAARMTLHLRVEGANDHHQIEACFKAVARALRRAVRRQGNALPSTKGAL